MPLEYRLLRKDENITGIIEEFDEKFGGVSLPKLDSYIEENPDDFKGYAAKSLMMQKSDTIRALEVVNYAIERFGENDILYHVRGMLYEIAGQRDSAIESFKKAIDLNPINIEARMSLGTMLNRSERHEEAKKYWKQIIEVNPEIFHGWSGLARSEYHLGDYETALKHANAALFTAPKNNRDVKSAYRTNRMGIYLKLNELEKALYDFEEAFGLNPRNALEQLKSFIQRATEDGNLEQAKVLAERLLEIAPDGDGDASWYFGLGTLYTIIGEEEKIDELFEKGMAAGLDPNQMMDFRGMVLLKAGLLDKAIETYEKLIERTGDLSYGFNIIQMAEVTGNREKAEEYKARIRENKQVAGKLKGKSGNKVNEVLGIKEIEIVRPRIITPKKSERSIGRNEPCPCGSGLKFKKCCGEY